MVSIKLPFPYSWRRAMLRWVSQSQLAAQSQYVLKFAFIFVFILFLDAANRTYNVQTENRDEHIIDTRSEATIHEFPRNNSYRKPRFKGSYFPWVLLAFDVLRMGDVLSTAIGIIAGHIYYYLQDLYPASGGPRLLNTPQLLYRYFPPSPSGIRSSFGTVIPPRNQNSAGEGSTHIWGRGQRLGSS
ncbi:3510_t:CDS:2 [Scutellospora calospora]|uniref:3510_t:CDS:1 n=1 Tax=Scutellospora calospora TaxID=85575 RepID=A0ACA9K5Z8_9GLOM|nr:3510_t:CDS:2 [Scutellospora calospora]